eukprot:9443417-Heterocapsa_arctica.AAC.1
MHSRRSPEAEPPGRNPSIGVAETRKGKGRHRTKVLGGSKEVWRKTRQPAPHRSVQQEEGSRITDGSGPRHTHSG